MVILSATLISRQLEGAEAAVTASPGSRHTSQVRPVASRFEASAALPTATPLVTDLTSTSFAVVFTTLTPQQAYVEWGTSPATMTNKAYDDRDTSTGPATILSTVHRFVLSSLSPNTTYYYSPMLVGGGVLNGSCGQAFQQRTAPLDEPLFPAQAQGTVQEADSTKPVSNTVLLLGVWTNADGSTSWPVSTFNSGAADQTGKNLFFFSSSLVTSDGTAPFSPDGRATFTVSAHADSPSQPVQLLSGTSQTGNQGSYVTTVPVITLAAPASGPTATDTPVPQSCAPTNTPTSTPTPAASATPPALAANTPLVTDLTSTSFAVVFTTLTAQQALVKWGTSPATMINKAYDDRDASTGPATISSTVHRFVLSSLSPNTTYYYSLVVGDGAPGGVCGQSFQQLTLPVPAANVTPVAATGTATATPVPSTYLTEGAGTVQEADHTAPGTDTVLLLGVWTNSDGSTSWPVSALNDNGANYQIASSLASADGTHPFYVTGNARFTVSAYADSVNSPTQLLAGVSPQTGKEGSAITVVPVITLSAPSSGPTPTNTPTPPACTATNTPTSTPTPTATGSVTGTATSTPTSTTLSIPVQAGWNLISLSLQPSSPLTAQQLLNALITSTGGNSVELFALNGGAWSTPATINSLLGSNGVDFTLQPGVGYLLYTDTAGNVSETGIPPDGVSVSVQAGWNLIGIGQGVTGPSTAQQLLNALITSTGGNSVELFALNGGAWSTPATINSLLGSNGVDFTLQPGVGYLLYTDIGSSIAARSAALASAAGWVEVAIGKDANARLVPLAQPALPPVAAGQKAARTATTVGTNAAQGIVAAMAVGRTARSLGHTM
jgi:hypothetical protein